VLRVIDESGLEIARASEYLQWIGTEKKKADKRNTVCETVI